MMLCLYCTNCVIYLYHTYCVLINSYYYQVFVGNLPHHMTIEEVTALFQVYGEIMDIRISLGKSKVSICGEINVKVLLWSQ